MWLNNLQQIMKKYDTHFELFYATILIYFRKRNSFFFKYKMLKKTNKITFNRNINALMKYFINDTSATINFLILD